MENTIGIRLQQLIKDHEQTNAKAAEAIGVSASLISDIINGKKKQGIGADIVKRICEHYHVSSDWLLGIAPISDERKDFEIAMRVTGLSSDAMQKLIEYNNTNSNDFQTGMKHYERQLLFNAIITNDALTEALSNYFYERSYWLYEDRILTLYDDFNYGACNLDEYLDSGMGRCEEENYFGTSDIIYQARTPMQRDLVNAINMQHMQAVFTKLHDSITDELQTQAGNMYVQRLDAKASTDLAEE